MVNMFDGSGQQLILPENVNGDESVVLNNIHSF